ncbi:MAG: SBBP repeat-containing protein [Crocosphaera sp.]
MNEGGRDIWIRKSNVDGTLEWSSQFGSVADEEAQAIATDHNGNSYVIGWTKSADISDPNNNNTIGGFNTFIVKIDAMGNFDHSWTKQFNNAGNEFATRDVAVDDQGNVFAVFQDDNDVFVKSYDVNGNLRWETSYGGSSSRQNDRPYGLAVHKGSVFITGATGGSIDGQTYEGSGDIFLSKLDDHKLLTNQTQSPEWTKLLGSERREANPDITVDQYGQIVIAGETSGSLAGENAGSEDIFFAVYNQEGDLLQTKQFGTSTWELLGGVAVDNSGSVHIAGNTLGEFPGQDSLGNWDVFRAQYRLGSTVGTETDDLLYGGDFNDHLKGFAGDDTIVGRKGDDLLEGGSGNDTFILASAEGTDTIADFTLNEDKIGLSGALTYGDLSFSTSGNDTSIIAGTETLAVLTGISDASTLTSDHFISV